MVSKRLWVIIVLICSFFQSFAQNDFYYHMGKQIPLSRNNKKVCVSISKSEVNTRKLILSHVDVISTIDDDKLDIFIIHKSDYEKLTSMKFWEVERRKVLLTYCYRTADNTEVFSTPYLNVRLKKEQDIKLLESYSKEHGIEIINHDSLMPLWYILTITPLSGKSSLDCANEIWESGYFAASVVDFCSDDITSSNDPLFNQQWGLENVSYPGIDISICSAWNYATGKNVKIGILDTGVELNHLDLVNNINSLSYDTETNSSPSIVYGDHATHCAGIAAAVKDNGLFVAGVAPEASIVSISNSLSMTTNSRIKRADGIIWAYQNGVDIISNSWRSSTYHSALDEAIKDAFTYGRQGKGCIIVFASGNQSTSAINYPANCNDTIIAVGAICNNGTRASFSNYGNRLDVVAPGNNILSTLPNNSVGNKNGTSMACPHVAGVAALILERNSNLTVTQVNEIINSNAKKLAGVNFSVIGRDGTWNTEYGYGLVDAYSSVINTPQVIFIQDEIITGDRVISSDSIYVGRNVTDRKQYGDVILGQGNIKLKANYIEIKNSTIVPLGTTLKIENP